jgi:hypothetical protein
VISRVTQLDLVQFLGEGQTSRSLPLTMSSGNMSPTSTAVEEPVRKARFSLLHPLHLVVWVLQLLYNLAQLVIVAIFKPVSPSSRSYH